MEVKTYKSITEIRDNAWDSIVGRDRLICRHRYLEAIEKSRINDCQFYYPVVYRGKEIVAHTSVYRIKTELDTFAKGGVKKIIDLVRKLFPNFLVLHSLECGTPVALGTTLSIKPEVNPCRVLMLISQETERLAGELGIKVILFRDFYDSQIQVFDYFCELGYTRIYNLPNTKMEIKWKSFEEYLDSMRSHYKGKIKRNMRKFDREDITIQIVKGFSPYAPELERLWAQTYERATEYKREKLTSVFFENINRFLPRSLVILAKKGDKPIGFSLLLFDDETLIPLFCGLDYAYNDKYCVYFNLFYRAIDIAIRTEMKCIDMGITTLNVKKDLGVDVFNLNMYMKHLNPMLNKVVPRIFSLMTPQQKIEPRDIFKNGDDRVDINEEAPVKDRRRPQYLYQ